MSEQARQVFDLEEQKAKDVLAAIKTIVPVIPLIREWGKVEQELYAAKNEEKKLREEIAALSRIGKLIPDISIIDEISGECNKRFEKSTEVKVKCKELQTKYDEYEQQVILYQKYVSLFEWVLYPHITRVSNLYSFEEDDEVLAILFFWYNQNKKTTHYQLSQILRLSNKQLPEFLLQGWNAMLAALKENEV